MVRHFLGVMFWSFISFVVFVNLFQFSGAVLPFEDVGGVQVNTFNNSVFGFSSLFTFVQTIGSDDYIKIGLNTFSTGFSIIKMFSIDDLVGFFSNMVEAANTGNGGLVILYLIANIFTLLKDVLVLPLVAVVAVFIMLVGLILFIWQLITIFFRFTLGYYNIPLSDYGSLLRDAALVYLHSV